MLGPVPEDPAAVAEENAHEGDSAQFTADIARATHANLVTSIVNDTEQRLAMQFERQLNRLLEAAGTKAAAQFAAVAELMVQPKNAATPPPAVPV